MSKSVKVFFCFMSLLILVLASGCVGDSDCPTCVADPYAVQNSKGEWVAKPTPNAVEKAKSTVIKTNDNINNAITGAPGNKTLIETIGSNAKQKDIDDFGARCMRFGGSIEPKSLNTLGCFK